MIDVFNGFHFVHFAESDSASGIGEGRVMGLSKHLDNAASGPIKRPVRFPGLVRVINSIEGRLENALTLFFSKQSTFLWSGELRNGKCPRSDFRGICREFIWLFRYLTFRLE